MKDLILITAYCPDDNRENILRNLVTSLEKHKNIFDVMITSHTPIPLDIQKKVDVSLFDKKNEILTDWDLLNQPWFNPNDERRIQSSFLSKKNTHLAIWRLMILGFSTAKNMGYRKVHHIEYDCEINEISEFIDNSELLNKNNSVVYMDVKYTVDEVMFGSFQSYFIPKIHKLLIELDEEKIKDLQAMARCRLRSRNGWPRRNERVPRQKESALSRLCREGVFHRRQHLGRNARSKIA